MGVHKKLERLREDLTEQQKINFNILADKIAKIEQNLIGIAKITKTFSIVSYVLKDKLIVSVKEYEDASTKLYQDTKVLEESSLEPQKLRDIKDIGRSTKP